MLDVRTHTDGGQTAEAVGDRVAAWLAEAWETLDLALYDVRLPGAVGDRVADAIRAAAARGVRVRIAYNQDERPEEDGERPFFPAPPRTEPHVLETLGVPVKPIPGWRDLMQVFRQWEENPHSRWKGPLLLRCLVAFHGKRSTPYAPGAVHDYMHAKVTVADDVVFLGSFSLSRSGEENAENVLEIADARLADRLAGWIDELRARYPALDQ